MSLRNISRSNFRQVFWRVTMCRLVITDVSKESSVFKLNVSGPVSLQWLNPTKKIFIKWLKK